MQTVLKRNGEILIFADDREKASQVLSYLKNTDAKVLIKRLDVGDYIVSDRVCIERKTSDDFVNSIIDGRLFKQAEELIDNFASPVLVIEGNHFRESMNGNAIKAAIASLIVKYRIAVLMTEDEEGTAKMVYWLAKKDQVENNRCVGIRGKKKPKGDNELLECIVSGFPGISGVLSKRILERFGTVERFMNATEEELLEVEGIGKSLAGKIVELKQKNYGKRKQ